MRTNLNLTPLERRIKANALYTIRSIGKISKPQNPNTKWWVGISMLNDGVPDEIYYNYEIQRWSHIKYSKYVGRSDKITEHVINL